MLSAKAQLTSWTHFTQVQPMPGESLMRANYLEGVAS
jgi:hypothetical protein